MPNSSNGRKSEGAAAESPSSSLERNMKPSDFALLRQKSSDALDLRQQHVDGRRATMLDEYNKKLKQDSNIEALKKSQSPTSSFGKSTPPPPAPSLLGKSPTGSLSKAIQPPRTSGSPTFPFQAARESAANAGSKESLSSGVGREGGAISERVSFVLFMKHIAVGMTVLLRLAYARIYDGSRINNGPISLIRSRATNRSPR